MVIILKKYLAFLLIVVIMFGIVNISYTNGIVSNEVSFVNLDSDNFVSFVKRYNLDDKVRRICTTDFCDYVDGSSIEDSFSAFKSHYDSYLGHDCLSSFPITNVILLD